ncbi:hypothetical protein FA95DRAFT_58330 [Auriscalpium vulgare]|uniref:Uncharacterized protein n=1 Tax=Auriscalpium vulgare TaxID=40419 RepID=A0ACB8S8E5_9AGAM|nr:hypothetical protein FA95DRAFT_58330 [Auriscalpium vulgare]
MGIRALSLHDRGAKISVAWPLSSLSCLRPICPHSFGACVQVRQPRHISARQRMKTIGIARETGSLLMQLRQRRRVLPLLQQRGHAAVATQTPWPRGCLSHRKLGNKHKGKNSSRTCPRIDTLTPATASIAPYMQNATARTTLIIRCSATLIGRIRQLFLREARTDRASWTRIALLMTTTGARTTLLTHSPTLAAFRREKTLGVCDALARGRLPLNRVMQATTDH